MQIRVKTCGRFCDLAVASSTAESCKTDRLDLDIREVWVHMREHIGQSKHGWQGEQKLILDVVFSSHYSLHIGTDFLCVSNDIVVWSMAMILNHFFFSNSSYIGQNIPRRSIFMTINFIFIINKNWLSFSHHSFSSGIPSWHLCTLLSRYIYQINKIYNQILFSFSYSTEN